MRGKSHDVADRFRMGPVAATLMLASFLCAQCMGAAEAKSARQCQRDNFQANQACNAGPAGQDSTCWQIAYNRWKRCMCDGGYKAYCYKGASDYPYNLSPDRPPKTVKPQGVRPFGTPPKSSTPDEPQGPGIVGTPPKSNPTPGVKPQGPGLQGPGNVGSPPKSNSSPGGGGGGGPIFRSGNSGNSNSNTSGGGNSGGPKR